MKIKHLFIIAAAALVGLASCSKEESGPSLSLSVDPAELNVVKEGGNFALTVTANCEWQAKSTVAWATIDKTEGNGNGIITVTVTKNYNEGPAEQTQAREGNITFTFGNEAKTVKVYQYGEAEVFGVEVAPGSSLVQGEDGGSILFTVTASNKNYTVTLSEGADKWITRATPKSAYTLEETFTVAENSDTARTATITFTMPGVLGPKEFTIHQEAGKIKVSITNTTEFLAMLAKTQTETAKDTAFVIMNDIDFTGVTIAPENSFQGNFYATLKGNGKKFTNYTATGDMIQHLYGTVKDLTIESGNFTLEPDHSCGIFFEQVRFGGVAENLINKATISGDVSTTTTFHQGALCGICRGTMTGCENQGNVNINVSQGKSTWHYRFGGICGSCTPDDAKGIISVQDCKNTGSINIACTDVKATVYLGGLFGVADSKKCDFVVKKCSNSGKLTMSNPAKFAGTAYVGGLMGQRNEGAITDCTNTGEIDLTAFNVDKVYAGGLIAFQKAGYTDECFQGCKVNAKVKAAFLKSDATGANTLANAGMVLGNAGDAGVTFGTSASPIVVGGSLYAGTTEIKVTSDNALELALGAASTAKPTFNLAIKNVVDGSIAPIIYPFPRP